MLTVTKRVVMRAGRSTKKAVENYKRFEVIRGTFSTRKTTTKGSKLHRHGPRTFSKDGSLERGE